MHTISSYHGNRPTNKQPQTHPQTRPITIHCTAKLSARCKYCVKTSHSVWLQFVYFVDNPVTICEENSVLFTFFAVIILLLTHINYLQFFDIVCWFGDRKGIQPIKNSVDMLALLIRL